MGFSNDIMSKQALNRANGSIDNAVAELSSNINFNQPQQQYPNLYPYQ